MVKFFLVAEKWKKMVRGNIFINFVVVKGEKRYFPGKKYLNHLSSPPFHERTGENAQLFADVGAQPARQGG